MKLKVNKINTKLQFVSIEEGRDQLFIQVFHYFKILTMRKNIEIIKYFDLKLYLRLDHINDNLPFTTIAPMQPII